MELIRIALRVHPVVLQIPMQQKAQKPVHLVTPIVLDAAEAAQAIVLSALLRST